MNEYEYNLNYDLCGVVWCGVVDMLWLSMEIDDYKIISNRVRFKGKRGSNSYKRGNLFRFIPIFTRYLEFVFIMAVDVLVERKVISSNSLRNN